MALVDMDGFQPRTVDKVERLLDLLEEMDRHPALRGRLAMHGGTAINLFMLDMPRLSVDIDVSYIGSPDRERMLAERPDIENGKESWDTPLATVSLLLMADTLAEPSCCVITATGVPIM